MQATDGVKDCKRSVQSGEKVRAPKGARNLKGAPSNNCLREREVRPFQKSVAERIDRIFVLVLAVMSAGESDVFAKAIDLDECHRGDILAIRSAGAYGEIMASQYNCRPLPKGYIFEEMQ